MLRGKSACYKLLAAFLFFMGFTIRVSAQIPDKPTVSPDAMPPVNMTAPQLQNFLQDKNADAGKDKNAALKTQPAATKDSIDRGANVKQAAGPLATYGANVFEGAAHTSISELSTPPLDYPIGVGDHVIVSLYGGAELQQKYEVATDGSIFPGGLGKIYVGGLTFDNVRRMLYSRFSSVVPAGTNIDISLGEPRSINVNVVNEVNSPGIITISAFSNAFNVIAAAGGVTPNANLRNIIIKRGGRVIEELDVYKYLQTGDFGRHIYLQNNDFIIVPFYEKKVQATGQFKRPMFYQLRQSEGIRALLQYSGGLTPDALASNLKVIRTESEQQVIRDVNANAILNLSSVDFPLRDGDIVKADLIRTGLVNKVEITGEVKYPDTYEIRKGDRLFDLINRAGGITRNTYLQRAYIFRGAGDSVNLRADKVEVNLNDFNNNNFNSASNVLLQPNDIVRVFGTYEFNDPQSVQIFGEVRKPGPFRKYGGMTLQDLIYLSGGLTSAAEFGRLEIASIVDVDSAKLGLRPTRTTVTSYAINQDLSLDSAADRVILKPYDQVFVRRNPNFELQQNVEVRGLFKYPGLYAKISKQETLSSVVKRAGGFVENANLAGAVMYRTKTGQFREAVVPTQTYDNMGNAVGQTTNSNEGDNPVSIDIYKALKYPNTKYDIILQPGDVIFVPEINPFVTVRGRVQSPLKIAYDKEHTRVPYYIDRAGGFGIRPWKRRVFVTYSSGKSRRTKNFLFFHFYPKVEEGVFINVPIRPQGEEITDIAKSTFTGIVPVVMAALILRYIK